MLEHDRIEIIAGAICSTTGMSCLPLCADCLHAARRVKDALSQRDIALVHFRKVTRQPFQFPEE